jgi:hypothetical protein
MHLVGEVFPLILRRKFRSVDRRCKGYTDGNRLDSVAFLKNLIATGDGYGDYGGA